MKKYISKRILSAPLLALLLVLACIFPAAAASDAQSLTETTTEIVRYDDGSYDVVTLTIETPITRAASTKSGSKTVTKYSTKNVKQYSFTVKGVFAFDGSSAWATNASTSYQIFVDGWSCTDRSASKSGNSVTGTGTFKKGFAVNYPTATISCSPSGVLS